MRPLLWQKEWSLTTGFIAIFSVTCFESSPIICRHFLLKFWIVARYMFYCAGADPGFAIGGEGAPTPWGRRCPTRVIFGKNVCKNERIRGEGGARGIPLDLPMLCCESLKNVCKSFDVVNLEITGSMGPF